SQRDLNVIDYKEIAKLAFHLDHTAFDFFSEMIRILSPKQQSKFNTACNQSYFIYFLNQLQKNSKYFITDKLLNACKKAFELNPRLIEDQSLLNSNPNLKSFFDAVLLGDPLSEDWKFIFNLACGNAEYLISKCTQLDFCNKDKDDTTISKI